MRRFTALKSFKLARPKAIHLPYLVLLTFVALPLLGLFHHDFWDGSRIGYAQDSNDFSGVRHWFYSASVEGQYFQEYFVNKIADVLKVSALFLDHALVIIGLLVLIREVTIFCRDYLGIKKDILVIPGLVVAIFPSISLTVSSVLTFYITSLALGWYSSRKYSNSNRITKLLAFLGILFSFEYGVMLLVCPILVMFYSTFREDSTNRNKLNLSLSTITVFISALSFKILMLLLNNPEGIYTGYNQLRFPTTLESLGQLAYGSKSYSSFLLYPIMVVLPAWIFSYFSKEVDDLKQKDQSQPRLARIFVVALFFSSVFPYLAVGKSTSLFWLDYWSGRHSFALIPSIAVFSASALDRFLQSMQSLSKAQIKIVVASSSIIILSLSSLLFFRVLASKYFEQQNRLAIVRSIESVKYLVPPGFANLYVENAEFVHLNSDETNYLMYNAIGNLNTYSVITDSGSIKETKDELFSEKREQKMTLHSLSQINCITEIRIRRLSELSQFPKMVANPRYKVEKIDSICPK